VNEIDRGRAWGREREHAQGDVFGVGWGWLGGCGAQEREWLRLGNTRGAVVLVRPFVWSERQGGGADFEVLDPGSLSGAWSMVGARVYPRG
jgi:hypothetical protein